MRNVAGWPSALQGAERCRVALGVSSLGYLRQGTEAMASRDRRRLRLTPSVRAQIAAAVGAYTELTPQGPTFTTTIVQASPPLPSADPRAVADTWREQLAPILEDDVSEAEPAEPDQPAEHPASVPPPKLDA